MESLFKNRFSRMKNVTGVLLCILFFMATGCGKFYTSFENESEQVSKQVSDQLSFTYPETGKYGPNILAEGFLEAKKTEFGRYEYSVRAELPAGNSSLKIVIKSTKHNEWGGWNQGSDENWVVSNVGGQFTCTVYESGKRADASVIFTGNCIIEYYENGSKEPTKVKEIKVDGSFTYPEPVIDDTDYYGTIFYPETGKYGPNILAEGFLEAKKTEFGRYEYSVKAVSSSSSSLKIVMKPAKPISYVCDNLRFCGAIFNERLEICPECGGTLHREDHTWGGWNQGSDENWIVSNVGSQFTCTVYESGKRADASVIFTDNCIIEYYENGAKEPTKVKEIKVDGSFTYPEPAIDNTDYYGTISYPEEGKYGPNILAEGFLEAKKTEFERYEYSVKAVSASSSSLKIVMKPAKPISYVCYNLPQCGAIFNERLEICPECGGVLHRVDHDWGGWNQGSDINWLYSNVGNQFTCTVYESGMPADASVIFINNCIIEYYENGAKEPTKVKEIIVID